MQSLIVQVPRIKAAVFATILRQQFGIRVSVTTIDKKMAGLYTSGSLSDAERQKFSAALQA